MAAAAAQTGLDVGAYVLMMVIPTEPDAEAMAKWASYQESADLAALSYMGVQRAADTSAAEQSTARHINLQEGAINFNMGKIVGSYETCARLLDEAATVEGTTGLMLTSDDFFEGIKAFGARIQPLVTSRSQLSFAAE